MVQQVQAAYVARTRLTNCICARDDALDRHERRRRGVAYRRCRQIPTYACTCDTHVETHTKPSCRHCPRPPRDAAFPAVLPCSTACSCRRSATDPHRQAPSIRLSFLIFGTTGKVTPSSPLVCPAPRPPRAPRPRPAPSPTRFCLAQGACWNNIVAFRNLPAHLPAKKIELCSTQREKTGSFSTCLQAERPRV